MTSSRDVSDFFDALESQNAALREALAFALAACHAALDADQDAEVLEQVTRYERSLRPSGRPMFGHCWVCGTRMPIVCDGCMDAARVRLRARIRNAD